jgi:hypothetical protein
LHPAWPFHRTIRVMGQYQFVQVIYERSLTSPCIGR